MCNFLSSFFRDKRNGRGEWVFLDSHAKVKANWVGNQIVTAESNNYSEGTSNSITIHYQDGRSFSGKLIRVCDDNPHTYVTNGTFMLTSSLIHSTLSASPVSPSSTIISGEIVFNNRFRVDDAFSTQLQFPKDKKLLPKETTTNKKHHHNHIDHDQNNEFELDLSPAFL